MANDKISTFIDAIKLVLDKEFPDLTGRFRYPAKAIVVTVHEDSTVDLLMLDKSGKVDPSSPPFPKVLAPKSSTEILIGDIVRIGFYYNDPTQPFIEEII